MGKILAWCLPAWAATALVAFYLGGTRGLSGALVGLILVLIYASLSLFTAAQAMKRSVAVAQGLMVGSFWLRLILLGLAIYLLVNVKTISIVAVVVTFVVDYSVLIPAGIVLLPIASQGRLRKE